MPATARDVLAAFDALSPAEQHEVTVEILRRSTEYGDLSDAALEELAAELFRGYDAEEFPAMPNPNRGEVWVADLGIAAKTRPCLVLSVAPDPQDRVLFTVVSHTTSVQGTRFEVAVPKPFLKPGAFDAQGLATVTKARFRRQLGKLQPAELALVEDAVKRWLGF